MAAAALPAAAARARATSLRRGGRRGLRGRALRVGPRHAHAHALHAGAHAHAALARRRGGAGARYEGGVPGVPQAAGAAAPLPGAAGAAAAALPAVPAVSPGDALHSGSPLSVVAARPRGNCLLMITTA